MLTASLFLCWRERQITYHFKALCVQPTRYPKVCSIVPRPGVRLRVSVLVVGVLVVLHVDGAEGQEGRLIEERGYVPTHRTAHAYQHQAGRLCHKASRM